MITESIKLFEENIGGKCQEIGSDSDFLAITPKHRQRKQK